MRKITYAFFVLAFLAVNGCKTDDVAAPILSSLILSAESMQGTWNITTAEGTEWRKGTGIITPKAADPGTLGIVFNMGAGTATITMGTSTTTHPFTLDATNSKIFFPPDGNTSLGMFSISGFSTEVMYWEQREPIDADYTLKTGPGSCGCELYFQKFWTLTKQ